MKRFRDAPFQKKLMLLMLVISLAAITLSCISFILFDHLTFRQAMVRDRETIAKIVGDNSHAALNFLDPEAAEKTLRALKKEPSIGVD